VIALTRSFTPAFAGRQASRLPQPGVETKTVFPPFLLIKTSLKNEGS